MTRFPSLGFADFEVRTKLRERFNRDLRGRPLIPFRNPGQPEFDDIAVLRLLLDTRVSRKAHRPQFEVRYEHARASGVELPPFADALSRGWFRLLGEQVVVSMPMRDFVRNSHPPFESAFEELMRESWLLAFTVGTAQGEGVDSSLVAQLDAADSDNFTISVRSPAWVAARLWDRDPRPDLLQWVTKWRLLGSPDLTLDDAWVEAKGDEFRRLAVDTVAQAGLPSWQDFADISPLVRLRETGDARGSPDVTAQDVPTHLLGKHLTHQRSAYAAEYGDTYSDLITPLRLVAVNLARRSTGPLPYPEAESLVQLAGEHPQVLEMLEHVVQQEPVLVADLLMDPRAAALATYLVAVWPSNARTEQEAETLDREQRLAAFADCVRAIGDHLSRNGVDPAEFAELLFALEAARYNAAPAVQDDWMQRVSQIVAILSKASPESQTAIIQALLQRAEEGTGTPGFSILLQALGALPPTVVSTFAERLREAYKRAIAPGADVGDVEAISSKSAHGLVHALLSLGPEGREALRNPVDVLAHLAPTTDDSRRWRVASQLAESMRTHIRILARAICVYGDEAPVELVDAFERVIRNGAISNMERGRVAAFSGFNEVMRFWRRRQRPIAHEVAQAVGCLDAAGQSKIVKALLQIDEPGVLADLSQRLPAGFRPDIENRVGELLPEDAGPIATLSELQRTIQQLLGAGLTEAASRFMSLEETLRTIGINPGRVLERFRTQLHFRLLKEQFDEILDANLPEELGGDKVRAQDTLDLYRGLVFLQSSAKKDAAQAAAIFHRLYTKYKTAGYAINLLAARLSKILPTDTYAKVTSERADLARYALQEAERALPSGTLNAEDLALHGTNVATLQLSLGRTTDARATLRAIDANYASPASIALEAVAIAREGRPADGVLLLRHARIRFGQQPAFEGAERHITEGAAYIDTARVVEAEVLVESWRKTFSQFKDADAHQQVQVHAVNRGVPPLEDWMTVLVRDGLAGVVNLVTAFHLDDPKLHSEDDLNTLVREVLKANLSRWYGWAVGDQSLGGVRPSGQMGERDLVIAQHHTELAVIEAMKFSTSGKGGIESHLRKVSSYANCVLFFHVVYSHEIKPENVLEAIKEIAPRPHAPLKYLSMNDLAQIGNQPDGLVARYEDTSGRRVAIVFLVVDLLQHGQKTTVGAPVVTPPIP